MNNLIGIFIILTGLSFASIALAAVGNETQAQDLAHREYDDQYNTVIRTVRGQSKMNYDAWPDNKNIWKKFSLSNCVTTLSFNKFVNNVFLKDNDINGLEKKYYNALVTKFKPEEIIRLTELFKNDDLWQKMDREDRILLSDKSQSVYDKNEDLIEEYDDRIHRSDFAKAFVFKFISNFDNFRKWYVEPNKTKKEEQDFYKAQLAEYDSSCALELKDNKDDND